MIVIQIWIDRGRVYTWIDDWSLVWFTHYGQTWSNWSIENGSHHLLPILVVVCIDKLANRHDRFSVSIVVSTFRCSANTQMPDRFRMWSIRCSSPPPPHRALPRLRPSTRYRQPSMLCVRSHCRPSSRSTLQHDDELAMGPHHRRWFVWKHVCFQSLCHRTRGRGQKQRRARRGDFVIGRKEEGFEHVSAHEVQRHCYLYRS